MDSLEINIYDKKGKVKKTAKANLVDLEFGQVRKIMDLLEIESVTNTIEIVKKVNDAWDEIKEIIAQIFPELNEEELDSIKLKELIPMLIIIVKYSFAEIVQNIPQEKN